MSESVRSDARKRPQWITLALPAQHGAWGFWLEPSLAGLIAAPSPDSWLIVLAGLGALLTHHPLLIAWKDLRKGRIFTRTRTALVLVTVFAVCALLAFSGAWQKSAADFTPALLAAAPFAAVFFWHDLRNDSRSLIAEVCGAVAFAAIAPACALAAGWPLERALAVWLLLISRAAPSIIYVRERLHLEKGRSVNTVLAHAAHGIALAGQILLALLGRAPWLPLLGGLLLFARALRGLSPQRQLVPTRIIGFREIAYGIVFALLTGVGYRLFM